jgi:pimeloyl-ACP methyl ester carboxylesterase
MGLLTAWVCMAMAGWQPSASGLQRPVMLQEVQAAQNAGSQNGGQPASPAADAHGVAGEWDGTVAKLRLVFKLDQVAGGWKGTLTSLDQGNAVIPIDTVSFAQGVLHLDFKTIGAAYEGTLNSAGTEINGVFQQGGSNLPMLLRRPGSPVLFTYKGKTVGRVPLEPCSDDNGNIQAICGKYEVYENRQSHAGRKISLKIMVLPATGEKPAPDPVFAFAGGPGQGSISAYPLASYIAGLRRQRDVVLVDQRGTGESNQLPCELRDRQNAQTVVGDFFSFDKLRACRTELEKRADLTQYTTSIFADDMDEVRQAMGYDKVNILGGSYGTKSALVFLHMHPEHVRTVTLEAVAPTQYKIPLSFSRTIQHSVDQLIAMCGNDAECHKAYPDLKSEFKTVLERLDKSPAHFDLMNPAVGKAQPVTLSRGAFVSNLRPVLYVPQLASQFPYMVHHAYQNDWTPYGSNVLLIFNALEKVIARGMSFSVICAEDVSAMTEQEIGQETAGTYLGDYQVRLYQQACKLWTQAAIPKNFYEPVRSDVPTLLIAGALDPATPPESSEVAAHDLKNSRTIVVKEGTHGTGSPCIDGLIGQFISKGSAEGLDGSCADQIHLPPFRTQ